jgi:hypothetical protein
MRTRTIITGVDSIFIRVYNKVIYIYISIIDITKMTTQSKFSSKSSAKYVFKFKFKNGRMTTNEKNF